MTRPRDRPAPEVPKRVSQDATPANPMTNEQRINRARAVAQSAVFTKIAAAAEQRTGRPRLIPLDVFLAAFVFHASGLPRGMTTAGVCDSLKRLAPEEFARLGMPAGPVKYKRVHSGWRAIRRVLERGVLVAHDHELEADETTGEILPCPDG